MFEGREKTLLNMLGLLRHRGPDELGVHHDGVGLGHARLSLVGLENGRQPFSGERQNVRAVCAGEIFNYVELKRDLQGKGHRFTTLSDCEVIVHLYEEYGMDFLPKLNGQFAFALWDGDQRELYLGRDRFGILPLFYTVESGTVVFASEIKAILAYPGATAELDPKAVDQIFTFWTTVGSRTPFKNIFEVRPGHVLKITPGEARETRYWRMDFPRDGAYEQKTEAYYVETLEELLKDSVRLRLAADVPVGVYLSGGVDSSLLAALAAGVAREKLKTFSVTFEDEAYDESRYQKMAADHLGLSNVSFPCSPEKIAQGYERVIQYAERPILRAAPVPLYFLSDLVRRQSCKAVIAGEGADEFLLGYDLFKEFKVRESWSRDPRSGRRPLLLNKLYSYLPFVRGRDNSYLKSVFSEGLARTGEWQYSHAVRWKSTARLKTLFSQDFRALLGSYDCVEELKSTLDADFGKWDGMARAQYLEATTFLSHFLLSSQGDRMAMAHGVEVRYPYLDHRVVEFCNRIPPQMKMKALKDKFILRKIAAKYLPAAIAERPKMPYRAPRPGWLGRNGLRKYLTEKALKKTGYFDARAVGTLSAKLDRAKLVSESDDMALNGVLSLQILDKLFLKQKAVAA